MKKFTLLKSLILSFIFLIGSLNAVSQTTINFDNATNWVQDGAIALSSYGNHAYSESGVLIQGTNILRNGISVQDGFSGAIGTYSLRVGNTATSKALITISTGGLANFTLKVRRWDGSPMPNYTVKYSLNGGTDWSNLANLDGSLLTTSDWFTYNSGDINSSVSDILIEIANTGTTERIMIDDFTWTDYASNCTPSNLAFANATVDKVMGDAAFTEVATSLNTVTPITYSSDATNVATVDANTGEVTLVGAGVATITASQVAGTDNAVDYCEATTTYTLNVTPNSPTITVTEVTVPEFTALVGNTDTENITVSGINLTNDITVALSGDNADQFSLSQTSVTQTSGTAPETVVTVSYIPTAAGSHTATLTLSSAGADDVVRTLTGTSTWKPLDAPVATDASASNSSGFTANWEAVTDATEYQLDVYTKTLTPAADLFVSEYSEGTSSNKYLEIYNGTGSSVDLSAYVLKLSPNGTGWPTDVNASNYLPLTGTLVNGDVYVIANGAADPAILNLADLSITYNNTVQGGTLLGFNGNDAIGLFKNDALIDLVGDPAVTTNFDVAGVTGATAEHTLVRKATVSSGNTNWALSAGTDEISSEWVVSAQNTWTFLGSHNYSGLTMSPIAGSPFTVTGVTSKEISGLDAGSTYYYTVIAKNAHVISDTSNEINANTLGTSLNNAKTDLTVYTVNGKIIFEASANQTVEIYNAIGQKLISRLTVEGLNSISVNAHGMLLVKIGNKISKVII